MLIIILAYISQFVLSSIAISKPIFSPPQTATTQEPTDRETSLFYKIQTVVHRPHQEIVVSKTYIFLLTTVLFSILTIVFSTSELEIRGIKIQYAIFLLSFSCFFSLNSFENGRFVQNMLVVICGVLYLWLEQINIAIVLYFQAFSKESQLREIIRCLILFFGVIVQNSLLCYGISTIISKLIFYPQPSPNRSILSNFQYLQLEQFQLAHHNRLNSKGISIIASLCSILVILGLITIAIAILSIIEQHQKHKNQSLIKESFFSVLSLLSPHNKILDILRGITSACIVGRIHWQFYREMLKVAQKQFEQKLKVYFFIVMGASLGMLRLASQYI